jgi:hypothetical protein
MFYQNNTGITVNYLTIFFGKTLPMDWHVWAVRVTFYLASAQ